MPENDAAVKFVSDGNVAAVDGASTHNGPADVPSTSVDTVVETPKNDKDKKDKEEKPKAVGIVELVNVYCVYSFSSKLCTEDN